MSDLVIIVDDNFSVPVIVGGAPGPPGAAGSPGGGLGNVAASKLIGRGSAGGIGVAEEITLGTNLSMVGTTVNAAGGGGSGATVGEISAGDHSVNGDGVTNNAVELAAADTAALAIPAVIAIPAGIYAIASDITITSPLRFAKGAKLKPAANVDITLTGGYIADDWNHCFDISASGSTVHGNRAPMGYYTPQHFGADPTNDAVDDRPAIEAATEFATLQAIRDEYATGFPVKFPNPGLNNYYTTLTRPIYPARTTYWYGDTQNYLRSYGGVEIRAATGLDAVVFAFHPGGLSSPAEYETTPAPGAATPGISKEYGAFRSKFEDLSFLPISGASVAQGFVHNVTCYLTNCRAAGFTEAQFHAHAQTSGTIINALAHPGITNTGNTHLSVPASTMGYTGAGCVWGNVNGSIYTQCFAQEGDNAAGGAHGFVAHGNNAGTIKYIGCDAALNQGAGILENTTIGCEIFGCHTSGNDWDVSHGGVQYLCIKYNVAAAASEPGVGADWQDYWMVNTSVAGDEAWASGQEYHPAGGVNVCSGNSRTTILAHYSEGGVECGVIARDMTSVSGGNARERTFWHGEFAGAEVGRINGTSASPVGYTGQRIPDDITTNYGAMLGSVGAFTGGIIQSYGDAADDPTNKTAAMQLSFNVSRGRYVWTDNNSNIEVHGVTGAGFTGTNYTALPRKYAWANGILIGNGTITGLVMNRWRAATNLAAITDATYGAAYKGDIWIYTTPSLGGFIGAICTTAGTIGAGAVITEFGRVGDINVQTITSAVTVTPTFLNDQVNITAQAVGLTLANPTGTAVSGKGIAIRVKDNGVARTITYGAQYRPIGVTLTTTTVPNKMLYLGGIWNATDSKLDIVAVAQEA